MIGFKYLKNVVTLKLEQQKCIGCAMCTVVCPHAVFTIKNKKAFIAQKDSCMECGACAKNCSVGAIYVETGVGCAAGILNGLLKGTEPSCDCYNIGSKCC